MLNQSNYAYCSELAISLVTNQITLPIEHNVEHHQWALTFCKSRGTTTPQNMQVSRLPIITDNQL